MGEKGAEAEVAVGAGMVFLQPRPEHVEFGLHLIQCDTGLHARPHRPAMRAAVVLRGLLVVGEWLPEGVGAGEAEALGHDADYSDGLGVEGDDLAEDVGLAAVGALPERVAEDDDLGRAGLAFLGPEEPPEFRLHAKRLEAVGGDPRAEGAIGPVIGAEDVGAVPGGERTGEGLGLPANVMEVRDGEIKVILGRADVIDAETKEGRLVGDERQRAHQQRVVEREHRRRRGDAERQGEGGDRDEAGAFGHHPQGEPEVVEHFLEKHRRQITGAGHDHRSVPTAASGGSAKCQSESGRRAD